MFVWRCKSCDTVKGKADGVLGTEKDMFCFQEDSETKHILVEEEEGVDACI